MFQAMDGRRIRISRPIGASLLNQLMASTDWGRLNRRDPRRPDQRRRWSLKYLLWTWILMGFSPQRQSQTRFEEAVAVLSRRYPTRRRPGRCYQGLAKAARIVGPSVGRDFWTRLRETLPARTRGFWHWHGRVVLAVDGSRFDAARTVDNERSLGLCGRDKTHSQWNVTLLMHLPTGLLWDWRAGGGRDSERAHLGDMLKDLPASTLLVADAGFVGFDLLNDLHARGAKFLIRCCSNVTLLTEHVERRIDRRPTGTFVFLWPAGRRNQLPLILRLIVLKRHGRRVYLMTNELEPTRLSRSMACELYAARWGIEVGYRELKQTLDRRKLLSGSPKVAAVELTGNLLAWALLRVLALMLMGRAMIRLSIAAALRAWRRVLDAVRFGASSKHWLGRFQTSLRDDYRRRRTKSARDWPHKKREPTPGAPIIRTLSASEWTRIQRLVDAPESR